MKYLLIILTILTFASCGKKAEDLAPGMLLVVDATEFDLNGTTYKRITFSVDARYAERAREDGHKVDFTISPIGKFDNGESSLTQDLPSSGIAHVFVTSADSGKAVITAKVDDNTMQAEVIFVKKPVSPDSLALTVESPSLVADGNSVSKVTVVLGTNLAKNNKDVTFKISPIGRFTNNTQEITVPVSLDRTAITHISGIDAGVAYITATAGGVSHTVAVTFTKPTVAPDSITLIIDSTTMLANGTNVSKVTVTLGTNLAKNNTEVKLKISPIGRFTNNAQEIDVPVSLNRQAITHISSVDGGVAYITATVAGITQVATISFTKTPAAVTDTVKATIVQDNVDADYYSYAIIEATVPRPAAGQTRSITFNTDKGTFADNNKSYTVTADAAGNARAYLKHNKAEIAIVTISSASAFSTTQNITFKTAWPENLFVDLGAGTMSRTPGSTVNVIARLTRNTGTVSEGITVSFKDSTQSGTSVGTFFNVGKSGSNGNATATYSLQDTSYQGYIYIVSTVNNGTNIIRGVNRVLVQ